MREVRWRLQVAQPGSKFWVDQDDRVYSGWFHSTGDDEPSPTVMVAYEKAVEELIWLDVRLIQETKSFTTKLLKMMVRTEEDETPTP